MPIWKQAVSPEILNTISRDTAVSHLGIEFIEVGDDFLRARVPVGAHTRQPYGLLHGGVSVVLAETLGSCSVRAVYGAGCRTVVSTWMAASRSAHGAGPPEWSMRQACRGRPATIAPCPTATPSSATPSPTASRP